MRPNADAPFLPVLAAGLALVLLASAPLAHAFANYGYCWLGSDIPFTLQLGQPAAPLSDGTVRWDDVAVSACADWNLRLGSRARFTTEIVPLTAPTARLDHANNVFFSPDIYGLEFDARLLAVTVQFEPEQS